MPRWKSTTVRFRITLIAAVAVGLVLTASSVGLVLVQRAQLLNNFDTALEQRADQLETSLSSGDFSLAVTNSNSDDSAIQVVRTSGFVLTATNNLSGRPAVADPPIGGQGQVIRSFEDLPLRENTYRVLSRRVVTPSGPMILHVIESIDDLRDTLRLLVSALVASVPVVVLVMTALVWILVGRTLRPVELIRAEVDAVSDTNTARRVPVSEHDDEISRLARTMNGMLDRLSAANRRQQRFIADASHELRSPLTRIRTQLEVDRAHPDHADLVVSHRQVLEETIALQELVNDLLYLAGTDAMVPGLCRRPTDIDDLLLEEVRSVRITSDINVDIRGVSAAHSNVDPRQIKRAIRNLLDNATRHAATSVVVELSESGRGIELTVTDDGPGVPNTDIEMVFERFARTDEARARDAGGTGLGLAISREIAQRHGGTLVVDPGWPDGARFVLNLPSVSPPEP